MQPTRKQRNSLIRYSARHTAVVLFLLFAFAPLAYASFGNISSTYKYAWSNVGGWINFAPTQSPVTVTSSTLIGYAWSANDGWINLSPAQGGVTNNGSGTLGGFAWDESIGWVSFEGVTIDSSGRFHGTATGASGYAINFDCSNCDVKTSWRPVSTANITPPSSGGFLPVFGATSQQIHTAVNNFISSTSTSSPQSSPLPSESASGIPSRYAPSKTYLPVTVATSAPPYSSAASNTTRTPATSTPLSAQSTPSPAVEGVFVLIVLVAIFFLFRFLL